MITDWPITDLRDALPKGVTIYGRRKPSQIHGVVLHHTASSGTVQQVAHYHVKNRGWPGIGYTFFVDFDGTVFYVNDIRNIPNAQGGGEPPVPFVQSNTNFLAVVLRGNTNDVGPSRLQAMAVRWLWTRLRDHLGLGHDMLFGHREFKATECPGAGGMQLVQKITNQARDIRALIPTSVLEVQAGLVRLGQDIVVDGDWGPKTQAALYDVTQTGRVDFPTVYRLAEMLYELGNETL